MKDKLNILIIGNGHYATGSTVLEGKKETDKDFGVILPSILELKKQGLVGRVYLAARNGKKFPKLREKLKLMNETFGWDTDIRLFPKDSKLDSNAYKEALERLPAPKGVIIATPDHLHKEMILESIKHKCHFLVVKPAVTTLKDLEEIIEAQYEANVLGLVDYHKVYDEANLILKDDYEKGKYGKIQHIFTRMTQRRDMLSIFKDWIVKDNNINHYLGCHYIHLVGFITKAIPINVRATCQYGVAKNEFGIDTPDLIETQVTWRDMDRNEFVSYHIAGWSDPSETSSMTYQEIHIISTEGYIVSDQRYRGFETVLVGKGQSIVNPYFFYLNKYLNGEVSLDVKYGFKSIKVFVESALAVENGANIQVFEKTLPTIRESRNVTAVLEAADKSLKNDSSIVKVDELILKN
ncbi:Gfo/Idh/MocA family protein [Hippea jasoniae]|uniref:Gfo/Idh/MocA family protein n=1 Tax=Hippea jasoniae TaxID=944479 RepID=UPI0005592EE2|nr:Gfo/Idh/MocA family oxidoreductase [Hippea jasoniae]